MTHPPRHSVLAAGAVALSAALAVVTLAGCGGSDPEPTASPLPPASGTVARDVARAGRVLVLTRTTGFRHDGIADARDVLADELGRRGYEVVATEDPGELTDSTLADVDAVAFVQTTGDVLGPDHEAALERFVRAGGGWAGVHAATDTEYDWPFYAALAGARFARHPAVQPATVRIEDGSHPSTAALAPLADGAGTFTRIDEWYDFDRSPRGQAHVLATVDESTYDGGGMGADHPVVWCDTIDAGHTWYTALGHPASSWREPAFVAHVASGIDAVARGLPCGPPGG